MSTVNPEGFSAFHAIIHGRVQGVGFRYNTHREARRRRLGGWVRNLPDGTVEVVCEGESKKVRSFAEWLGTGPPGAHVTRIDLNKKQYKGTYIDFSVEF